MRRGWIDRALVVAALVLVAAVTAQGVASWLGGGHPKSSARSTPPPSEEAEEGTHGTVITLVSDGSTTCQLRRLRYEVVPGPALRVSRLGARCEPPYPELIAVVHGSSIRFVPALDPAGIAIVVAELGGLQSHTAPLADGLRNCRPGRPDGLRTTGAGSTLKGTIPCGEER